MVGPSSGRVIQRFVLQELSPIGVRLYYDVNFHAGERLFLVRKQFYIGEGFSRHTEVLTFFVFKLFYSGASIDMYNLLLFLGIKCEQ